MEFNVDFSELFYYEGNGFVQITGENKRKCLL